MESLQPERRGQIGPSQTARRCCSYVGCCHHVLGPINVRSRSARQGLPTTSITSQVLSWSFFSSLAGRTWGWSRQHSDSCIPVPLGSCAGSPFAHPWPRRVRLQVHEIWAMAGIFDSTGTQTRNCQSLRSHCTIGSWGLVSRKVALLITRSQDQVLSWISILAGLIALVCLVPKVPSGPWFPAPAMSLHDVCIACMHQLLCM